MELPEGGSRAVVPWFKKERESDETLEHDKLYVYMPVSNLRSDSPAWSRCSSGIPLDWPDASIRPDKNDLLWQPAMVPLEEVIESVELKHYGLPGSLHD